MNQDTKYGIIFLVLMACLVFTATAIGVQNAEKRIINQCTNSNSFQIGSQVFECKLKNGSEK